MVPDVVRVDGRRIRFAVTSNVHAHGPEGPGSPPVWAVNIHGYFAGGGMYWRESQILAETLGWRVVNPSLPGFAGSDSLPWEKVGIHEIADQIAAVLDHLGVEHVVLFGHSMGAAVAVAFATSHPERTLGLVYRDGAATPAWKQRHGLLVSAMAPLVPDLAGMIDLLISAAMDLPDLLIGRRLTATVRGMWPDAKRNIRALGRTVAVGAMLLSLDMREELHELAFRGEIPLLGVWGSFDRVSHVQTAREFEDVAGTDVVWIAGGHSWMLARPQTQSDVLRVLDPGKEFLASVDVRRKALLGLPPKSVRANGRRRLGALPG
jgi:pimeloyl-ACP methyl ester carboxylesterase